MKNMFDEKTEGFYQGLQWVLDNLELSEENIQTLKSIMKHNDVEEWRDIKGYEDLYQVSNKGKVKSLTRITRHGKLRVGQVMKQTLRQNYYKVHLSKDGTLHTFQVHRLVADAFLSNPENKHFVDHINTITTDNRVENLRWVTCSENKNNPISIENFSKANKGTKHPIYNGENKLKPVGKYSLKGELLREYKSISEAARENNLRIPGISSCVNGRNHTCGGYIWKAI